MDSQVFETILADIASGQATHRALSDHGVPRKAFYALLASDIEAGNRYARAKMAGLEVLADECIEIADDGRHDEYLEDGVMVTNQDVIARARLRVDTRKWLLSKLAPKKYGEHLDLTVGTSKDAASLSYDQLLSLAMSKQPAIAGPQTIDGEIASDEPAA